MKRRDFVLSSLGFAAASLASWRPAAARPKLKILVLGGTRFLGPHVAELAMARGHTVTFFNRGRTNPGVLPQVERIQGDRNGQLDGLKGRSWDAVIDTSGYFPRQVRSAAEVLSGNVGQYVFISSISVYASPMKAGMDETAAVMRLPEGTDVDAIQDITGGNYGALKLLCDEAAEKAMPGKALNVRPGYIVGDRDGSDRFTYWPVRVRKGGEVLVAGKPTDPLQFIDVRDLGDWVVRMVESGTNGVFNATGPKERLTMKAFLEACRKDTKSNATFTWAPEVKLKELGLTPEADFPIWVSTEGPEAGIGDVSIARALKAGLTFRPLSETISSTLGWWDSLPEERRAKARAGLASEKEAEVLAALKAKAAPGAPAAEVKK